MLFGRDSRDFILESDSKAQGFALPFAFYLFPFAFLLKRFRLLTVGPEKVTLASLLPALLSAMVESFAGNIFM